MRLVELSNFQEKTGLDDGVTLELIRSGLLPVRYREDGKTCVEVDGLDADEIAKQAGKVLSKDSTSLIRHELQGVLLNYFRELLAEAMAEAKADDGNKGAS